MNLATLPKARFKADRPVTEKARAMVRRGKSDQFISDYLGMETTQVEEIRRATPGEHGRPPSITPTRRREAIAYATRRAPLYDKRVVTTGELAAEEGSVELRRSLLRYGAKHGLPNLSHLQCITELRTLCAVREEELDLLKRFEAEMCRPSKLKEID